MPLIKSASKKALQKNIETEMKSNPDKKDRSKNIAIAYSIQRQAKKKKMAEGGEVKAASFKPDADEHEERSLSMLDDRSVEHGEEADLRLERHADIDDADDSREMRMMLAEGGEVDLRKEKMVSIDDEEDERSQRMLDGHPTSHDADQDLREEHEVDADSRGMYGSTMTEDHDEESLLDGVPESIHEAVRLKMLAKGGMVDDSEVDLQDSNGDEHLNDEDDLSFEAARKKTYYDLDQVEDQPEDSNLHGDDLADEDEHDMVSSIRRKVKSKRM